MILLLCRGKKKESWHLPLKFLSFVLFGDFCFVLEFFVLFWRKQS